MSSITLTGVAGEENFKPSSCRPGLLPTGLSPLGQETSERAAHSIFGEARQHGRISASLSSVLRGEAELYLATAGVGEGVDRCYWLTTLVDGSLLRKVCERVPPSAVRDRLAGVGSGPILRLVSSVYTEIDDVSVSEQIARYTEIEEATGLRWALWVHSGGKSVHAYLAIEGATPTDLRWIEALKLLAVLVGGDPAIASSPRRLMRLPGFVGSDGREQRVLLLRDETNGYERYSISDVRDRLRALYERRGGVDLARSLDALEVVARLRRHGSAEARELATRIYEERLSPGAALLDEGSFIARGGRYGVVEIGPDYTPPSDGGMDGGGHVVRLPASAMARFERVARGTRVNPPCGGPSGHTRPDNGVVLHESGESPRIYCHACNHTLVVESASPAPRPVPAPSGPPRGPYRRGLVGGMQLSDAQALVAASPAPEEESALREYLSNKFSERRDAKFGAAAELDPRRGPAAARAISEGRRYRSQIQASLEAQGLVPPEKKCHFRLGLTSPATRDLRIVGKACKKLACPHCAPSVIADKLGASLVGAVVNREGRVTGYGLATRPVVYRYELDDVGFSRWVKSRRDAVSAFSRIGGKGEIRKNVESRPDPSASIYVAFRSESRVVVLSDLPPTSRGVQPTTRYGTPTDITAATVELTLATYRMEATDIDEVLPKKLAGSITSSNNLHLDPETLRAEADPTEWYVAVRHPDAPEKSKEKLEKLGVTASVKHSDDAETTLVTSDIARIAASSGRDAVSLYEAICEAAKDPSGLTVDRYYHDDDLSDLFSGRGTPTPQATLDAMQDALFN